MGQIRTLFHQTKPLGYFASRYMYVTLNLYFPPGCTFNHRAIGDLSADKGIHTVTSGGLSSLISGSSESSRDNIYVAALRQVQEICTKWCKAIQL